MARHNKRAKKRDLFKKIGLSVATVLLMFVVYKGEQAGQWFKASILEAPQPFNGTVVPVSKVPNWTKWKGDNYTTPYSAIASSDLIDFPQYDLELMSFPDENLIWGNAEHDRIRNTKITYPVVYLGNYELNHVEGAGSHPAVDIKMPVGTPVRAIANGKVVKISTKSTGFGHHIVIKHPNVPDPDNPGSFTTLYSSYSHMDEVNVSEGQNVLKGEQIGTSGNSGVSTTPHLHFQIDRESAPWHPYWPFSWQESQEAGLSFFEAINAGLGINNAKTYTINPLKYVYANLNTNFVASDGATGLNNPADSGSADSNSGNTPLPDNSEGNGVEIVDDPFVSDPPASNPGTDPNLFSYKLSGETVGRINNGIMITVTDESGQLSSLSDTDEIRAEISGVGTLLKKKFTKNSFKNGTLKLIAKSASAGQATITIGRSSHQITFVENVGGIAAFKIEHDGFFQENVVEVIKIVATDTNGNPTGVANFSGAVDITAKEGSADITPARITSKDFKNGVAEVRIKSNSERLVIRAQQGALVGESSPLTKESKNLFSDVYRGNKNYDAIKFLKDEGIINGYPDGSYKPGKTVNRVEALKMLMLAFNINPGVNGPLPFNDTDDGAWYAGTLGAAINKQIVQGYPDGTFKPGNTVNRAELLKILFKTADVQIPEVNIDPYDDVPQGAWFSPYAYLAKKKNVVEGSKTLRPADGMTRADVAEAIYRMKMIQNNNLVTYSK